ncbi:MAG: hypothetical protein Q7S92_05575 [Candidatus Diapherotrites archaeon]|nr:hypothetical protein [Candidatus Diapherotrites archaeon]
MPELDKPKKCEICGSPNIIEVQCKIICPECGYTCDCAEEPGKSE